MDVLKGSLNAVIAFANAGLDTENCIKQAAEFGLNNPLDRNSPWARGSSR